MDFMIFEFKLLILMHGWSTTLSSVCKEAIIEISIFQFLPNLFNRIHFGSGGRDKEKLDIARYHEAFRLAPACVIRTKRYVIIGKSF
jgi:hypothetical protein